MRHETIKIQVKGSKPDARLVTYILDKSPEMDCSPKPIILICPGGGYEFTSDREAEGTALAFASNGYHAVVLRYSCSPAVFPTALLEVAEAVKIIRKNAKKWNVDPSKIIVQGCSAGGHLACSYGCFYNDKLVLEATGLTKEELRPAGIMLSYPVITSGSKTHVGSIEHLLGDSYENLKDTAILKKVSLETQVHKEMPPVFVWHTFEDGCVPPENSLLLVGALKKKNVPTEFHLFPAGGHGLGLANELTMCPNGYGVEPQCQQWFSLALNWLKYRIVNNG